MKKTTMRNRILSGILALVTLFSLMPIQTWGTESAPEVVQTQQQSALKITRDGETVDLLHLASYQRIEIVAEGARADGVHQWQILHPEKDNVWINIYDGTHGYLYVTLALVRNMLREDDTTQLRCRVTEGEQVRYTNVLTVQFCEEIAFLPEPPVETTEATVPQETAAATEPVETTEATEPVETTEATVPVETTVATEPVETTEATEPVETTEATVPVETTVATEPIETTEATEPAQTTEATEPEETIAVTEPAENTEATVLVDPTETTAPAQTPEVTEPVETTAATELVETTEATVPVETFTLEETLPDAQLLADTAPPEFVKVTIEYVRYDFARVDGQLVQDDAGWGGYQLDSTGTQAFTSYVATLQYGSEWESNVPVPTMVGYDAYLEDGTDVIQTVNIPKQEFTKDTTYVVKYKPKAVSYVVRYYFQNVYDDLYVENTDMKVQGTGLTGLMPPDTVLKKQVDGFLALYYQPDMIAADGSTIFEVYYERNYYLMEFDCNGGYGTETLYVRYGTFINVPSPTKAGWVFRGWDLLGNKDTNDDPPNDPTTDPAVNANILPATMPAENTAYIAIWGTDKTTYTVAYWIVNDDGKLNYVGSHIKEGTSGQKIDGIDNLGTVDSNGNQVLESDRGAICGVLAHTHTDACYVCGFGVHKHTSTCFPTLVGNQPGSDGESAIQAVDDGKTNPESGYIYVIQRTDTLALWPKLYLNGSYYTINNIGVSTSATEEQVATIIDGEALGEGAYGNLTVKKYRPKTNCGQTQHTHDTSCHTCVEHIHTDACRYDAKYLEYVPERVITKENGQTVTYKTDKQVTIEGDGSTVVNVYYQFKEYTLKFYYAATKGGQDTDGDGVDDTFDTVEIVGGSTYHFGGQTGVSGSWYEKFNTTDYSAIKMLDNMFAQWNQIGQVKSTKLPSLKEGIPANRYNKGSDPGSDGRAYHYISFKARYGDDISELWPCDAISSVEMKDGQHSWSKSSTATVSAWNGEHHIWYTKNEHEKNGNETIKGRYGKLDYKLLYHSDFANYTDYRTLSFLCFWENGANLGNKWNIPKLFVYNIWLPCIDNKPENAPTEENSTKKKKTELVNGTYYYLETSYDTCDDSNVESQTQPSITGFKHNGYTWKDIDTYDETKYNDAFEMNFYYTRNTHKLFFWNHNKYLSGGGHGIAVEYDEPLEAHGNQVTVEKMNTNNVQGAVPGETIYSYPDGLEPSAYEFLGWYTSPIFNEDTEADWEDGTVPDSDMRFYARWEPIKRDVLFFTFYDDIAALENTYTGGIKQYIADRKEQIKNGTGQKPSLIPYEEAFDAPHGETLESKNIKIPTAAMDNRIPTDDDGKQLYTFIGWFYMDEDNKKRFAPDTMEITQDLLLFGEWQTMIDTTYEIQYVLKDNKSTHVADTVTAHSSVGKTRTFTAKAMGELYPAYQRCHYPTVNTHSILMQEDRTKNTYTFEYVYDKVVYYKIRYLEYSTDKVLHEEIVKDTSKTGEAVVTEKFLPIAGYLPQNGYYIRKTLAYDANATADTVIEENVITFYYVKDEKHGIYSIEYYLQNADGTDYIQYESIVGTEDIKDASGNPKTVIAPIRDYEGYEHVVEKNTVITYNDDGTEAEKIEGVKMSDTDHRPYGTVSANGLTIQVYYNREEYDYTVEYWVAGSNINAVDKKGQLKVPKSGQAKFGSEISYSLHDDKVDDRTIVVNGQTYEFYPNDPAEAEKEMTKNMTIRAAESENRMIFYFVQKKVEVFYEAVCQEPTGNRAYGAVSLLSESAISADGLSGAKALPGNGFLFKGWYSDEACTVPVNSGWVTNTHLKPKELYQNTNDDDSENDWKNHYYALFVPVRLTIKKQGEGLRDKDTFLFRVYGTDNTGKTVDVTVSVQGEGHVTIPFLGNGTYTVQELTNWSWAYNNTDQSPIQKVTIDGSTENYTVTFNNKLQTPAEYLWLHGENNAENVYDEVTEPTEATEATN